MVELRCTYDPDSRSGVAGGRKVGATIHWVSAVDGLPAEVRLYGRLFSAACPSPTDLAADLDPHPPANAKRLPRRAGNRL
ncbi:hypothetical protein ACNJX9_39240 [Bradyrhizobium sp. DASA03076]|uniref:hypothetical protein n=1 Tax=Bradyrhizobium sp. BLXBL-03 TaxID=3395916 RepID=UPI003F71A850